MLKDMEELGTSFHTLILLISSRAHKVYLLEMAILSEKAFLIIVHSTHRVLKWDGVEVFVYC